MARNQSRDKPRRAVQEKFRKRSQGLFKKANELSQQTGSDIYILIYRNNRYHTYQSTDREGWPAFEQDIANHHPQTKIRKPEDFEEPHTKHDEVYEEDFEDADHGSCEEVFSEDGRRVIFMPKTPVLRLEPKGVLSTTVSR